MSSQQPPARNFWLSAAPKQEPAFAGEPPCGSEQDPDGAGRGEVRKIIHVDMDAFYASVEQRDNPTLRGRPVAVGGSSERGVVAAASYEARRFGVRSAMASASARRLCPELVFVKPRFEAYKAISQEIRAIFAEHTRLIEPLSLDEAYLDVTVNRNNITSATRIAQEIRSSIRQSTGVTASAGVSYNKFLAKLASDHRKPDGLFVVTPSQGLGFVEALAVGKFHGIGPVTAARMRQLGIATGLDLRLKGEGFLTAHFGKAGRYYYDLARAIDHRPVNPDRIRKSVGSETTFFQDLTTAEALGAALVPIASSVWEHCVRSGPLGRSVTLKVRYSDFRRVTRSRTLPRAVASEAELLAIGRDLVGSILPLERSVRLLGLSLSGFDRKDDAPRDQLALGLLDQ